METTGTELQPSLKVKTVELSPGRWIYVCPCGCAYTVSRVEQRKRNYVVFCFKCRTAKGKYYRVMDEIIEFEENPNGKLNCQCFSMLRMHNPIKNPVGAIKRIYLRGQYKGDAKVMHVSRIKIDAINIAMSKLDSGLLPDELRKRIKEEFRKYRVNWETQLLDFVVLEYIKESREPKLF